MSAAEARLRKLRSARRGGRFLFAVFAALAVLGNVQAAPDTFWPRFWHAIPPLAVLLTVEVSVVWVPELDKHWQRGIYAATGFIGAAAFALSYWSLYHIAEASEMGKLSAGFPFLFEAAALAFSMVGLGASRALADVAHEALLAEREAERKAEVAAERTMAADDRRRERESLAAQEAARGPSQDEQDALTLSDRYGETIPSYKAVSEALGWANNRQAAARKALKAMGPVVKEGAALSD